MTESTILRAVDEFRKAGFAKIPGAVDPHVAAACASGIADELRRQSVDVDNPATWSEAVVRFNCPSGPAFAAAGTSPRLWSLYDALLGAGNWIRREAVGGTVPVRFPSAHDPGDAGWHIDGSYYTDDGRLFANVHSRTRALLALFLFTDVTERDAPTEILAGSHRAVPKVLHPHGERGMFFGDVVQQLPRPVFDLPRAFATGSAGDVYVCHPFIVHRATWPHRGVAPRMLAQPEIGQHIPFALDPRHPRCVVEEMILDAL